MQGRVRELETSVAFLSSKYQDIMDSGPRATSTDTRPLQQTIWSQGEEIRRVGVAASADIACSRVMKLEECLTGAQPTCTSPSPRVHYLFIFIFIFTTCMLTFPAR
eukprot:scpid102601/ scgid30743/ 